MNKLFTNYRRTDILSKVAFILLYAIAYFHVAQASADMVMDNAPLYMVSLVSLVVGAVVMFFLTLLTDFIIKYSRLLVVPISEAKIIVRLSAAAGQVVIILGNLLVLLLPFAGLWIYYLFRFFASTVTVFAIYFAINKMYINDVIRPYFFKVMSIVYVVYIIVGVIL